MHEGGEEVKAEFRVLDVSETHDWEHRQMVNVRGYHCGQTEKGAYQRPSPLKSNTESPDDIRDCVWWYFP